MSDVVAEINDLAGETRYTNEQLVEIVRLLKGIKNDLSGIEREVKKLR